MSKGIRAKIEVACDWCRMAQDARTDHNGPALEDIYVPKDWLSILVTGPDSETYELHACVECQKILGLPKPVIPYGWNEGRGRWEYV